MLRLDKIAAFIDGEKERKFREGKLMKQKIKTIKKEFETYWSQEFVRGLHALENKTRFMRGQSSEIMIPLEIDFNELYIFNGKKTRVTIEIIE